jgi:hypothetical protein
MYRALDIETENTGSDIMADNKRILSVQIGDDTKQDLWWADSKDPKWNLESAKKQIESLLAQGVVFVGYNLKGFDVSILKRFLGVEIPESNILDLCECPKIPELTGKNRSRLEEACLACGIEVAHKQRMNERAKKFKAMDVHKKHAKAKAIELVEKKGWGYDFSYNYVLDKIAGGNAIYEAYQEFVENDGQKNSLFYEYAMGDIITEYRLFKKLGY